MDTVSGWQIRLHVVIALSAYALLSIAALQASYDELDPEEVASDVGAGEDEGGSEGDLTRFERDRIRARIAEERAFLEVIDAAEERSKGKNWKTCVRCSKPIGDARLEALPATDMPEDEASGNEIVVTATKRASRASVSARPSASCVPLSRRMRQARRGDRRSSSMRTPSGASAA